MDRSELCCAAAAPEAIQKILDELLKSPKSPWRLINPQQSELFVP